jgi:hypothetical protein
MKIHIAIVTDQQLANLLPLLADVPDKLLLLVSDKMLKKAQAFLKIVKKQPSLANVSITQEQGLPDSSIKDIQEFGLNILGKLEGEDQQVVFNLAGGTKLMALALSQVFNEPHFTQIYPNTEHDRIETLWPIGRPSLPLTTLLNTKQHIEAHSVTWRSADSESLDWLEKLQGRENLTKLLASQLATDTENTQNLIGQINYASANAQDKNGTVTHPQQQLKYVNKRMYKLLKAYNQHELIDWDSNNHKDITFRSKDALRYAKGGWLEEYFYIVAQQCELEDCQSGIKITDDFDRKADLRNELDGAIAYNNRLMLAECKTSTLGKNAQKDSDIIYKLDSIAHHIGGLYCTRILLSAITLNHTTKQNRDVEITKRAKAAGITVLDGANITHLESLIKYWQQHGNITDFLPGA